MSSLSEVTEAYGDTPYYRLIPSSPLSRLLAIVHWILFLEASYFFGFVGLAYGLGEGFPAALDILVRVLLFEEGAQAAGLLYVFPVFVIALSVVKKRLVLFPWRR